MALIAGTPSSVASLPSLVCNVSMRSIAPMTWAFQDMPDRDAEFARDGHRGLVASAPGGHGQAPLLQRVTDLEELLGGLDQERAQGTFAMPLQGRPPSQLPLWQTLGLSPR